MSKHICCVLLVRFLFCENEKRWFKQNLLWTLSEKIGSPAVEPLPATSTECSLTLAKLEVIGEERNRGHVTWLTWKVLPRHSKPSPTCPGRQVQFLWPSPKYTQRPYLLQPPLSYVMGKRAKAQMHTVLQILHELWHQTTRGVFSSSTEACWGEDEDDQIQRSRNHFPFKLRLKKAVWTGKKKYIDANTHHIAGVGFYTIMSRPCEARQASAFFLEGTGARNKRCSLLVWLFCDRMSLWGVLTLLFC